MLSPHLGITMQYHLVYKRADHYLAARQVFVTAPFTENRPDKLLQYEHLLVNESSTLLFQEGARRLASGSTIVQAVQQVNMQTAEKEALADVFRCMYFLNKHGISVCFLGIVLWQGCEHVNYESEMTMQELVKSIGLSLEDEILKEAKQSPYYGIIFDEVTGISIHKQLGLCIQYLGVDGTTEIRNLKLIKVSHGTAEAITETLVG